MSEKNFDEVLKRLDLVMGHCGNDSLAHNGGWFDKESNKIGWGDIGPREVERVKEKQLPGEIFFVVSEHDSYWDLPKGLDPLKPGLDFIIEKVRFFITDNKIYRVVDDDYDLKHHVEPGEEPIMRKEIKKQFKL